MEIIQMKEYGLSLKSSLNRSPWIQAVLVGSLIFISLLAIVDVGGQLSSQFSRWYLAQSIVPFDASNPLGRRFLMPLLGFLSGLSGYAFPVVIRLATLFFLIVICRYFLLGLDFGKAFLSTAIIGFLPITEFGLVVGVWPDIAVFLFFLLALVNYRYSVFWCILGIWTHEMYFFLIPMIPVIHHWECQRLEGQNVVLKHRDLSLAIFKLVLAGVIALTIREFLSGSSSTSFDPLNYFSNLWHNGPGQAFKQNILLATVLSFKALLILLPFWLATVFQKGGQSGVIWIFLLPLGLIVLALELAHDTTRMLCLLFPIMLVMLRAGMFSTAILRTALAIHILLPSYYVGVDWYARLRISSSSVDKLVENHWNKPLY